MHRHTMFLWLAIALAITWGGIQPSFAQDQSAAQPVEGNGAVAAAKLKKITQADRQAAADRLAETRSALGQRKQTETDALVKTTAALLPGEPIVGQGDVPDYYSPTVPNWNYTPPLRKFVDQLPLLGPGGANNLQQYIPIAVADQTAYPGLTPGSVSDYYEIAVVQFTQQMHSDLPATTFRGYVQIDTPAIPDTSTRHALTYPDGSPILDSGGNQVYSVDRPRYLGPVISARRDVPVRIKFNNYLPKTAAGGDLFIPVDTSVMGAGMGPKMVMAMSAMAMGTTATIMTHSSHPFKAGQKVRLQGFAPDQYNGEFTVLPTGLGAMQFQVTLKQAPAGAATVAGEATEMYTENRAVVHLHGGRTPWISDGTPHQWITPAGENTSYPQGVSVKDVPDMPGTEAPDDGSSTLYYTNQQSARLMFYHDHVYGITRLNVYVGEAAGYLIRDDIEDSLVAANFIPAAEIPLVIQDKTFVDAATIGALDPTWRWGTGPDNDLNGYPDYRTGDLWVPHVYMPAQNPYDISGMAAMGRWHYGPWFWPPTTGISHPPIPNPYYDPINRPWEGELIPDVPDPSMGMEAFNDTPIVNGTAYPTLTVDPKAYRFRVLSAANDRFFNLQLYEADPAFEMPGVGLTEVRMVDAAPYPGDPTWPQDYAEGNPTWPTDGREGGVPDWNLRGPDWIQIGTEGGFLPMPVVVPQRPVDWNVDVTTFDAGIVNSRSLLVAPAERVDVIVDFSAYAGKTLILFNDAPAAFPAPDPRYDYYTGGPDMTDTGGRWPTDPGYGPNTRTIMQIKVNPDPVADDWLGLEAMTARWESTATQDGVFKQAQDPIVVTQGELVPGYDQYNKAYNATFASTYPDWGIARIHNTSLKFKALDGSYATIPLEPKAIQDEMGETFDDYGRMSGKLGLQLPSPPAGGQTFVLQSYVDPATEVITSMTPLSPPLAGDGTQLWKITHNGVDVHPIHFHLFDVQLVNRVAWDNNVRLPDANELGWKDTIRVNPLQDTIVALRPVAPALPFKLPDSVRLLDPTMPVGFQWQSFDPYTADAVTITNGMTNFGWEYMWHCHILSHEEMEMMRPTIFKVSPAAPSGLAATALGDPAVSLTWVNNATVPAATALLIQRATDAAFTQNLATLNVADPTATTFSDTTVAPGTTYFYQIRAENDISYSVWSNTAAVATPEVVPANMNLVTYWNDAAIKTIKNAGLMMAASRALAMVHGAIYDSVNSITGTGIQYRMTVPGASGASPEAAVAAAAYRVLATMFPGQIVTLDAKLAASMSTVADGQPKTDGIVVGQTVADAMLLWRSTDHSTDMAMYMGGTDPGQWRPTPPAYAMGMMPLWGTVTPFAMTSGAQFRLAPPPALDSVEYAEAFNEVAAIGMMGSPVRTAEQTLIASFWEDRPGRFITVERWNAIALAEGIIRSNTLEGDARLFATLNIALADAGISSWDSKYLYSRWRPITAIQEAAADGNPLTVADPTWMPQLITPAHPEYASAHSTTGAAGAEVLQRFFGVDNANISLPAADNPAYVRSYTTYSQVVDEAGISRIYGGIHFRFSKVAGEAAGRALGAYVYNTLNSSLPSAPTSLTAVVQAGPQVNLAWTDNATNETGFEVERSDNGGAFVLIASPAPGAATYADATVLPGNTYAYRVRAVNASGNSAYTNTASVDVITPAAPTNLTATLQVVPEVTLVWTDNATNETGFEVERSVNGGAFALIASPAAGVATYTDTAVVAGNTYAYRVRAVNVVGSSAYTNTASVTLPAPPAAPTNLTATLQAGPQVALAWRDNANNETGFVVERSDNGGAFVVIATPGPRAGTGNVTYVDAAAVAGHTYVYQVKAVNAAWSSAYSNTASVTLPSLPAAPSNLTGTAAPQGRNNARVTLNWTDNANNETGFTVQRSTTSAFPAGATTVNSTVGANTTSFRTGNLPRNTTYWFRVRSFNQLGVSVWSNAFSITTP